jgi:hypothetical protein
VGNENQRRAAELSFVSMQQVAEQQGVARAQAGAVFPWLLTALIFASRLPYLRPGYGTDPDAYRVIAAARVLRTGEYTASRLPGYPLHEAATALLLPGGPRLVNGATALLSALAALALFRLSETLGLERVRATWLALAFAFTPIVFQTSTSSIDYVWSICFVLWSAAYLASGRAWLAGCLLGAAIGARITAGGMLLPLLWLNVGTASRERRLTQALQLCLAAGATAAICFAPVLSTYGLSFFSHDQPPPLPWQRIAERATTEVWGSLGIYAWCGVSAIAACALKPLTMAWRRSKTRWLVGSALSALIVFSSAFLMLPVEAGYLIPCVPFLLLIVAFLLPTLAIAELACLLLLSCFVGLDGDGLNAAGPVSAEHAGRLTQNAVVARVIRKAAATPGKALIIAGALLPRIEVKLGGSEQGPHHYLYLLQSEAELLDYVQRGYALYYVDAGVERRQRRTFGIALRAHGAHSLF